ncbi:glycosyltransferase family 4 protein [Dokdonella sp.]|uniref:MraY family glycosyltransferase n=1 Tax=Dokdonella sp. TaxID=2291710 RepID=UPI002F42A720
MADRYAEGLAASSAIVVATAALASVLTAWAIRYAHRRRLYDLPGQRRSHDAPTPRGGGIAIVVAMIAGGLALAVRDGAVQHLALLLPPVLGIAGVGWLDDHGGLSAPKRLAMHVLAAAWVFAGPLFVLAAIPLAGAAGTAGTHVFALVAGAGVTFALAWSINLHNFMDGIDGLLVLQAMFVLVVLAALTAVHGVQGSALLLACAAACAGFAPFNFPRARIFMGDVGSGVLGFVIGVAVLWQVAHPRIAATSGLVLCSAFVTDATCTLVSRMLGGRRWYSAHREHLYQWLVRAGFSHARVVALYMGWNLLVALPVVGWMNHAPTSPMRFGLAPAIAVYALASVAWWAGKRWCLRRVRERSAHAAA